MMNRGLDPMPSANEPVFMFTSSGVREALCYNAFFALIQAFMSGENHMAMQETGLTISKAKGSCEKTGPPSIT